MADLTITPAPGHTGQIYFRQGDDKRIVQRNIDLGDVSTVQRQVAAARRQYPSQALKMGVYRRNGAARTLLETINLSPEPALAGPGDLSDLPDVLPAAAPAFAPNPALPASDHFTAYILSQKDQTIAEKNETIRELRDAGKISQDRIRDLEQQNSKLSEDLRFKDREHQLELQGVEASQKKGLAGLGEMLSGFPPELITMFAGRLLGGPMVLPAAAPGPQLGGLSPGHRDVVEAGLGLMQHADEATATKLFVVLQQLAHNPSALDQIVQQLQPRV